jgi:ABC-type molybdate transport system substrate-binding protein
MTTMGFRSIVISLLALLLVACMTNTRVLTLQHTEQRMGFNTASLGDPFESIIKKLQTDIKLNMECDEPSSVKLLSGQVVKKSSCQLISDNNSSFADHVVNTINYTLYDEHLLQLDLKITAKDNTSFEQVAAQISQQLSLDPKKDLAGLLWSGAHDLAMLQQQGDILLRLVSRQVFNLKAPRASKIQVRNK